MTCEKYREELNRHQNSQDIGGGMSPELRDHLEQCLSCCLLLEENELGHFLEDPAPPASLQKRTAATIDNLLAEGLKPALPEPVMPWWTRLAAAALVVGFLGYGLWHAISPDSTEPLTAELNGGASISPEQEFQPVVTQLVSADSALEWHGTLEGEPAIFIDLQPEVQFGY